MTRVRTSFRAPGQFVHVKCGEGLLLRRPISVCTCYSDEPSDLLTIVFEVRGEGTDWLARRPVGHSLDVLGLAGNGLYPRSRRAVICWWAAALGSLPCWAAPSTPRESPPPSWAAAADKILQNCFQDECAKVLTATDDGSLGHHGFVDALVRQELEGIRITRPCWPAAPAPCCGMWPEWRRNLASPVRCPWRSGWAAAGPAWCALRHG